MQSGTTRLSCAISDTVTPLRARVKAEGLTHARLAAAIRYHRSSVSRALSGRDLPTLDIVRRIAQVVGEDVEMTTARWIRARRLKETALRTEHARRDSGAPPKVDSYDSMITALRQLVQQRRLSLRALVAADSSGRLRYSTVGAALRGTRSMRLDTMMAIVRACGVSSDAAAEWQTIWLRLGAPHRAARLARPGNGNRGQRSGYGRYGRLRQFRH
jgi:transcriptional regulator with XRE-family HTH domain